MSVRLVALALLAVGCGEPAPEISATVETAPPEVAPPPAAPAFETPIEWERPEGFEADHRVETIAPVAVNLVVVAITPSGPTSMADVGPGLEGHRDALGACYTTARIAHPWLHGLVYVAITVTESGTVEHAELVDAPSEHRPPAEWWIAASTESALHAPRTLEGCLLADVRGWTLPAGGAGTVVVSIELDVASLFADGRRVWDDSWLRGGEIGLRGSSRPEETLGWAPRDIEVHIGVPTTTPRTALAADVVRRVVRRHVNEIRFCYEGALRAAPELAGSANIHFVVSETGAVASVDDPVLALGAPGEHPLAATRLGGCIGSAVRRWTFPAPTGGVVAADVSFTLRSTPSTHATPEPAGFGVVHAGS